MNEFDYLTGNRVDAAITQEFLSGNWTLDLGYAFRLDDIGDATSTTQCPTQQGVPPGDFCESRESFGYTGHSLWGSLKIMLSSQLSLSIAGGLEFRSYLDDDSLIQSGVAIDPHQRSDQLFFAGLSASYRLSKSAALSLRYDTFVNQSNLNGATRGLPDRQYVKQVLSLGTLLWW
jgi:hypothetical protein